MSLFHLWYFQIYSTANAKSKFRCETDNFLAVTSLNFE